MKCPTMLMFAAPLLALAACTEPTEPSEPSEPGETTASALPAGAKTPVSTAAPPTVPGIAQEADNPCGAQAVAPYIG